MYSRKSQTIKKTSEGQSMGSQRVRHDLGTEQQQQMKTRYQKGTCTSMFLAALFTTVKA